MKTILISNLAVIFMLCSLTACTNREMGTVGGAALGGVAGSALSHGSAAGTVAGAVVGGVVGNQVTK